MKELLREELGISARVEINNVWEDGHESTAIVEVEEPVGDLNDWWEDEVWPRTGDGHSGEACYTATVVAAGDLGLVGVTREWIG